MSTLDYVDIPAGAMRLRASSSPGPKNNLVNTSADIRPAPRVYTSLPHPSPPSSPATVHRRQLSLSANAASSLMSPSLGFIPQLLLSATIPGGIGGSTSEEDVAAASAAVGTTATLPPEKHTLLSSRDPLSLPIMSNNFKRFVSKVGPVFWLQDRIEEIVLWKKGWRVTATWMAVYVFLCWYPRMTLLIPHVCIIGIILSTYPYPGVMKKGVQETQQQAGAATSNATEGSVPWQANIQAIQNLMGAVSDVITAIEPHVYHLVLSPAHLRDLSGPHTPVGPNDSTLPGPHAPQFQRPPSPQPTRPISPYTPHILTLLTITFPLLVFVISLPQFPIRALFIIGGLSPFVCTHPWIRRLSPRVFPWLSVAGREAKERLLDAYDRALVYAGAQKRPAKDAEEKREKGKPLSMIIQRIIDDDHLSDKCWNSEMREVELWENERYGGLPSETNPSSTNSAPDANATWSKANLRANERVAWTRGRDGWSGVGVGSYLNVPTNPNNGGGAGIEVQGEVSNLTFSLAPGWSFVETEDWRKDVLSEWSGVGADPDGWVYTNDAWLGARPAPYTAGGGSVTRRRRWTRRVWYDKLRAEREG